MVAVAEHEANWEAGLTTVPMEQSFDSSSAEQASLEEHLPEWNRGYALLAKMGWKRGEGCGRRGGGIVEPVRLAEQHGGLGLGKASEYDEYAAAATETRRAMTSELIASEDDGARAAREAEHSRQQDIADARRRETSAPNRRRSSSATRSGRAASTAA